jgi:outer membrane protein assembly complex protein YaeT
LFVTLLILCGGAAAQSAQSPPKQSPATQPPLIQAALKYEGSRITAIQFEPEDQPLTHAELGQLLPFQTGSAFHERDLQLAIQRLYSTGRFSDLAVDAMAPGPDRVALRFITKRAYFVGRVVVENVKEPPNGGQLSSATKLRLGAPYSDSEKVQAMESLTDLLRQNGLYGATVHAHIDYDDRIEAANLTFSVDPGKRARFEGPTITGDSVRPASVLIRATHWKRLYGLLGWQQVTDERVRQGLDNIRRLYQKENRLRATVALTTLTFQPDTDTVQPTINVNAGPVILVQTKGTKIERGKLKQLVPVFQEGSVDTDLLLEGQHNIENYLQSEGYFGAKVTYSSYESPSSHQQTVIYQIERGPRHKFVHLEISGNRYFIPETVRERLYLQPAEFPRYPYGRYSVSYLRQDVQAVENLYRSNGFRDVEVTSRIVDDYHGRKNQIAVFINIKEGRQWIVSHLSIEGASATDLPLLQTMIASRPGQPYSETNVGDDRDNVLNYYYNDGYPNAAFEYYVDPASLPNQVDLRYVFRPGERKYVRDIIVTGLETTRRHLVYDRIKLKAGEPLSLAENTESQRDLYDLGIFARVNTALQDPDGDEESKYVLYDLDEARHYSLNFGFGAQIARIGGGVTTLDNPAGTTGFAPRVSFGISRLNFLGLGQTVSLQTSLSTIEQRVSMTYFIPQFTSNPNLSLTLTGLYDDSNDIRTFTAHRQEGSIQLGQKLNRAYTVQYRLVFRHVTQSNLKIDPLLVPLLSQPERVGLGEFTLIQDKRDDPTDAHHGIYTTIDLAYAPGFLASQTHFGRGVIRNSTYYQLHRDLVLARSTQFGVIDRTGGRPEIPLAERFYSGGSTSIRAFPDFQAGPRDLVTGFPIGGNLLLTNNVELRFPLIGDNLGGVLFEDFGNVYQSLSHFSLRFRQENLQDFNYTVQNAGFGIRYRTPIGPVRLDFSFSPDAPRFYGLKGTEQDLINGTATSTVQKINAFQFHFSLGQAF